MNPQKTLAQNISSNWVLTIIQMLVGIFLVPFIIHKVGLSEYGIWVLVTQILVYITILNNGLSLSITRFAAFYRGEKNTLNCFVASSFWILVAFSLGIIVISVLISMIISKVFSSIPITSLPSAKIVCILAGFTLSVKFVQSNFSGVLKGFQDYVNYNFATSIGIFLRAILTIGFLIIWQNIIAIQTAVMLASIFELIFLMWFAFRKVPDLSVSFVHVSRDAIKELFRYTKHSVARTLGEIVMYGTMPILIGLWGTTTDVAIFDVAKQIPNFIKRIIVGFQSVFLPILTSHIAKKQKTQMLQIVEKATRLGFLLTMFLCILFFVFAESMLFVWLQKEISSTMVLIMRLLLLAVVSEGIFNIWISALVASDVLRPLTIAAVATLGLAIVSTVICHLILNIQISLAPAIGLFIAVYLRSGIWLPVYSIKKFEVNIKQYFNKALFKPFLASIMGSIILFTLYRLFHDKGTMRFFVEYTIAAIMLLTILSGFAAQSDVKDLIKAVKNRRFK